MTVEEIGYSLYEQCVMARSTSRVTKMLQDAQDKMGASVAATGSVGTMQSGSGNGKSYSREKEAQILETIEACMIALNLYAGDGIDTRVVSSTIADFSCLRL
jgi:hypothetical protein